MAKRLGYVFGKFVEMYARSTVSRDATAGGHLSWWHECLDCALTSMTLIVEEHAPTITFTSSAPTISGISLGDAGQTIKGI